MKQIARESIAKSASMSPNNVSEITVIVDLVVKALREKYGEFILADPPWMLNNAGGAMGSMLVRSGYYLIIIVLGSCLDSCVGILND